MAVCYDRRRQMGKGEDPVQDEIPLPFAGAGRFFYICP